MCVRSLGRASFIRSKSQLSCKHGRAGSCFVLLLPGESRLLPCCRMAPYASLSNTILSSRNCTSALCSCLRREPNVSFGSLMCFGAICSDDKAVDTFWYRHSTRDVLSKSLAICRTTPTTFSLEYTDDIFAGVLNIRPNPP